MDNPLTPEQQNNLIEEALRTYPVAAMPRDITGQVMSRLQAVPPARPFRLTWSDLALSMVLALSIAAIWFSLQNLPPLAVALLRKESILAYQYLLVNAHWLLPVGSFGVAAFLASLTIPYLKQQLTNSTS
jgi:hypothetical protein